MAAEGLDGVAGDGVDRKLGGGREAVVGLEADAGLLAVVVIVPRAVVPEIGGLGGGVFEIAQGAEAADGVFGVEHVERETEVTLAAEDVEELLPADVEERMRAVFFAGGRLLGERRSVADAGAVGDAATLAHRERRAALEIDRAADGAGLLVGRVALGELHLVEHGTGEVVHVRAAGEGALAGEWRAVERDAVEAGADAADGETVDEIFVGRIAGDAGEADGHFGGIHVRQVSERIHGDDVLHVFGVALRGDGGGTALALAGDFEGVEFVDDTGQVEVARGAGGVGDGDSGARRIEADIGDDDLVRAGGERREDVAAGIVGERGEAERRNLDAGALEEIAGGDVGDVAGEGGGPKSGEGKKEGKREGERK